MAFDYSPIAATASRLIAEFGQVCQVRTVTGATHNAATGVVSGGTTVNTNVNGVIVAFNKSNTPADALIQAGDKLAILDGSIGVGNELVHDSEAWECVQVWPIKPGDTNIVWRAQVRK
jgi:hypothetical protein